MNTDLNKQANILSNIAMKGWARGASRAYKKSGGSGVIDYLRKFKDPTHALPLGTKDFGKIETMAAQKGKATPFRGIRTSIGNTAENISILMGDVKGKGVVGGTTQAVKNVGNLIRRQVKGDLYREIEGDVITRGGKRFVKTKNPFMREREIFGETGRGSYIVRKNKALTPVSVGLGTSGLSIGAASYAFSDPEQPKGKRMREAATDAAIFSLSVPAGIASSVYRGIRQSKDNKKLKNT